MTETLRTPVRRSCRVRFACQHEQVSEDSARALAESLLAGERPQRWKHSQAVAAESGRLCTLIGIASSSVVAAAWLHDVGYAPAVAATGFHPLDGARYLRARRWDYTVCQLVAHHTDARHQVNKQLAHQLCIEFAPVGGLEHDVLWAADATCGPNGERFTLDERISEVHARYGRDHPVTAGMIASRNELAAAIARVAAACH